MASGTESQQWRRTTGGCLQQSEKNGGSEAEIYYATNEQTKRLQDLEMRWNQLHKEDMELDTRCGEIVKFYAKSLYLYIKMMGLGLVGGYFIPDNALLLGLIGSLAAMLVLGNGIGTQIALWKLRKMQWSFDEIQRRRVKLRKIVQDFGQKLVNGGVMLPRTNAFNSIEDEVKRVDDILDMLGRGRFKNKHVIFIGLTWFCIVFAACAWIYCTHNGKQPSIYVH